jgi:hypothetical protein
MSPRAGIGHPLQSRDARHRAPPTSRQRAASALAARASRAAGHQAKLKETSYG